MLALNCVNLLEKADETHQLIVRHLDRVGVLAGVLDQLRTYGINVQGMENVTIRVRTALPVPAYESKASPIQSSAIMSALEDVIQSI